MLTQLGAALVARDAVTDAIESLRTSLSSRQKAEKELQVRRRRLEAELKRFERRGTTARSRFEREAKKTRARVERDVKQRRNRLEREVKSLRTDLGGVSSQAELVSSRVENLVQSGLTAGQQAATKVQERLSSVA
jgi:predicted  nucleic acid-binding Zn-ribbon protein